MSWSVLVPGRKEWGWHNGFLGLPLVTTSEIGLPGIGCYSYGGRNRGCAERSDIPNRYGYYASSSVLRRPSILCLLTCEASTQSDPGASCAVDVPFLPEYCQLSIQPGLLHIPMPILALSRNIFGDRLPLFFHSLRRCSVGLMDWLEAAGPGYGISGDPRVSQPSRGERGLSGKHTEPGLKCD